MFALLCEFWATLQPLTGPVQGQNRVFISWGPCNENRFFPYGKPCSQNKDGFQYIYFISEIFGQNIQLMKFFWLIISLL